MKVSTVLSLAVMASSVSAFPAFWKRRLVTEVRTIYITEAGSPITIHADEAFKAAAAAAVTRGWRPSHNRKSRSTTIIVPTTTSAAPVIIETTQTPDVTPIVDEEVIETEAPVVVKPVETTKAATTEAAVKTTTSAAAAPVETESSSNSGSLATFAKKVVAEHNKYRALHSANALTWSDSLAASAMAHAKKCVWKHSQTSGQGENLYAFTGSSTIDGTNADPTGGIKGWYDEWPLYTGDYSDGAGHFTQVVWKGTTEVGCAMPVCNQLKSTSGSAMLGGGNVQFLVCAYKAPGNYIGQFAANVQAKPNSS